MDVEFGELAGDPDVLDAESANYASVAAKIDAAVATLRKLTGLDGMRGEAIEALARTAGDVADQIALPKARYLQTGEALTAYSPRLRQAKDAARVAAAHLAELEEDAATTASASEQAAKKLLLGAATMNPDDLEQAKTDAKRAALAAESAAGDLAAWQRQWRAAQQEKAEAAAAASARIVAVLVGDAARVNDRLRDRVGAIWDSAEKDAAEFGKDVKSALTSSGFNTALGWMDKISAGLGIAALCLCWVPGLGEVLGAADGIAALLDAGAHIAQDAAEGRGGKAAGDAALGLAGVFGGGVLRVVAKNIGAAARATSTAGRLVNTGKLSVSVGSRFAHTTSSGERLISRITSGEKTRLFAAKVKALMPSWDDVGTVVKDGGKSIKAGSAEWAQDAGKAIYEGVSSRTLSVKLVGEEAGASLHKFLGVGDEAEAELRDGALSRPWKLTIGVAQAGTSAVALHEHAELVDRVAGAIHSQGKE